MCYMLFFFFKQKTAYEMRISDWSSDVCSTVTLIPFADSVGASETFSFSAATDAGYLDLENALENLGQGYGGVGALGTNYDAALNAARGDLAADIAGLPANTKHSFYFLSDGEPNDGNTNDAIDDWQDFLVDNDVDAYAVGFGFEPSDPYNNYLEDIAGDEALYLQEASDLLDTFTGSVSLGESVEGNVLTDGEIGRAP